MILFGRSAKILQGELPQQQFNTWIRPLRASLINENSILLSAPNRFIEDWVRNHFYRELGKLLRIFAPRKLI